jgi:hypothetical protein
MLVGMIPRPKKLFQFFRIQHQPNAISHITTCPVSNTGCCRSPSAVPNSQCRLLFESVALVEWEKRVHRQHASRLKLGNLSSISFCPSQTHYGGDLLIPGRCRTLKLRCRQIIVTTAGKWRPSAITAPFSDNIGGDHRSLEIQQIQGRPFNSSCINKQLKMIYTPMSKFLPTVSVSLGKIT